MARQKWPLPCPVLPCSSPAPQLQVGLCAQEASAVSLTLWTWESCQSKCWSEGACRRKVVKHLVQVTAALWYSLKLQRAPTVTGEAGRRKWWSCFAFCCKAFWYFETRIIICCTANKFSHPSSARRACCWNSEIWELRMDSQALYIPVQRQMHPFGQPPYIANSIIDWMNYILFWVKTQDKTLSRAWRVNSNMLQQLPLMLPLVLHQHTNSHY